ncbi:11-S seed storage protein, plant, partial [Cynara cardunculus var. scolymus]
MPGCPETYEVSQQVGGFQDRHQKLYNIRQGDIIAIPAGAAHWIYNDGQQELRFYLAGNPQKEHQQQQSPWGSKGQSQEEGSGNIFQGFEVEILAKAFNVDRETAQMLQCQLDQRGHIVMVERGLQVIRPPMSIQEQQRGRNGIDETICSLKIRENIDDASRADFYNPQAGSCTHLNSLKFPILKFLQLGAQRGVLH